MTHGYDSVERVNYWIDELRKAAEASLVSPWKREEMLKDALSSIYRKLVEKGGFATYHKNIPRFTIDKLRPQLRPILGRFMASSLDLIKDNREAVIAKMEQRFRGWATSVPAGGTRAADKVEVKTGIRKSLAQLPFEERRVLIDQGHKLVANINETIAVGGNAIAGIWHSHWRQPNYDYREDHKERDLNVFAIRGNWALERGLMKPGSAGYYDEVTRVGEEPFCRCYMTWIYNLRDLPADMITAKGKAALDEVRRKITAAA